MADFPITINLLENFRNKQVALAYEAGEKLFPQIRERFKKVQTKLQNHRLQNFPVEDCVLVA